MSASSLYEQRGSATEIEDGCQLTPKFDKDGLLPCIVTDHATGGVLMLAYMNAETLALTIESGEAHYWSRSREEIWRKGATSGHIQKVIELRVDCDQDTVWIAVEQTGAACHTGYRSCFYRSVPLGAPVTPGFPDLRLTEPAKLFDPATVYGQSPATNDAGDADIGP